MKRIKVILILISSLLLTSCISNDDSQTMDKLHLQMSGMDIAVHLKLEKISGNIGGLEVKTTNYGKLLLSDGSYIIYSTELCPICGEVEYK